MSSFFSHSTADRGIAARPARKTGQRIALWISAAAVLSVLIWQGVTAAGNPNPEAVSGRSVPAILDIGVLVFREGLEFVLVLSAIAAGMARAGESYQRPVAAGVGFGFVATILTWFAAVGVVNDLTHNFSALSIQAGTGLLAIFVLLVVMNWFFHKLYWTGWISMHNKRKHELIESAQRGDASEIRFLLGMGLLGFTTFYREGVEVVLFLQRYRLKLGDEPVFYGVLVGCVLTAIVGAFTVVAHKKLPYKRMLVLTGTLLGVVLLIMVGEEAQEMQAAGWIPTTELTGLAGILPPWMGLWLSVYPTLETIAAQILTAFIVLGSYFGVHLRTKYRLRHRNARRVRVEPNL